MARRNTISNNQKPKTQRLKSSAELMTPKKSSEQRKATYDKTYSNCGGKGHMKDMKCVVSSAFSKHAYSKDEFLALKSRSGEPSTHNFIQFTACIEQEMKDRETSE